MKQYFNQLTRNLQISTTSPLLIFWKLIINLCSFAIYIEISLELFNIEEFQKDNRGQAFFTWRIIVITLLLLDICISFFIEYKSHNGIIIQKPEKKMKYYFKHYFIFDAIVVIYLLISTFLPLPFWVGLLVFFRIPSNTHSDSITEEYLIQYQFVLLCYRISKLIVILLYIFNFFACAFYAIGLFSVSISAPTWLEYANSAIGDIDKMHHVTQYIISYFWAVETLVSMGYGEITPMNQYEIIIGDIALVSCMFVCLYVISNIISFQSENSSYMEERMLSVKKFMIAKKISNKLYNEVSIFLSQFQQQTQKRDLLNENLVIDRIPNQLRSIMNYEANFKIIQRIPWISQNFSRLFQERISNYFFEQFYNANTLISLIQDDDPLLAVIEKGKISVVFNNTEIYQLSCYECLGGYEFMIGECQEYIKYRTKSITTITYIKRSDFLVNLAEFKEDQEKYFFIHDQIFFLHNFSLINEGCYICLQSDHTTQRCQQISMKDQFIQQQSYLKGQKIQVRRRFAREGKKKKFSLQKQPKNFQINMPQNFDIDKRYYSKLSFHWKPYCMHKQKKMLIFRDQLINESLQRSDILIFQNNKQWKGSTVFSSSNQYLFYWQLFMMLVNFFFFIAIPQIIFFWNYYDEFSSNSTFQCVRIAIILLFLMDFLFQFNINFYVDGVLVKNRFKIAKNYLQRNLLFDFIPILMLFYMSVSDQYVIVYLLGLVKLIPFYRFQFYLSDKLKIFPQLRQVYMIAGMLIEILYVNHFFGCMFYGSGVYMYTYHPNSKTWVNDSSMNFGVVITKPTAQKYLYSTYWAIDAITRIGYGDILPLNDLEFIITDLTVILAIGIVAVNISLIENMRKNSKLHNYFIDNMRIQQYLKSRKCSSLLGYDISNYLRYYHRVGQDRNIDIEQESLLLLPNNLKHQIMFEAYRNVLNKQLWFGNHEIIFELSNKVQEVYLGDNENIFLDNIADLKCALYYIDRGFVQLFINTQYSERKDVVIAHLNQGAYFGHFSFITGLPRKSSARTVKFASLIYVTIQSFRQVIESNPVYISQIQYMKDQIIYRNQFNLIGLSCYTCHAQDHLSIDCPLTSIKKQISLQFQSSIREKSRSQMSLRKLQEDSKIQDRRFRLRSKGKTKFIYVKKLFKDFNYVPPQGALNLIIDKL